MSGIRETRVVTVGMQAWLIFTIYFLEVMTGLADGTMWGFRRGQHKQGLQVVGLRSCAHVVY